MATVKTISFPSIDSSVSLSGNHFVPANRQVDLSYGIESITFDLRGVGESTGSATYRCIEEIQDAIAACDWVSGSLKRECVLVGSSAGAAIAGSALDKAQNCRAYVGIGYTFGRIASIAFGSHFNAIMHSPKPKLFIMGDSDGFTSVNQLERRISSMQNAQYILVEGIGHFGLESNTHARSTAALIAKFITNL